MKQIFLSSSNLSSVEAIGGGNLFSDENSSFLFDVVGASRPTNRQSTSCGGGVVFDQYCCVS